MKYTVSIAIDGRIDINVEAVSFTEAFAKARDELAFTSLKNMDIIGFIPVYAQREDGEQKDY